MSQPKVPDFRHALLARFETAKKRGDEHVTVMCCDLHDEVNPGGNKPAVCSGVMWVETTAGNCQVQHSPPGGAGRSLTIRYGLPRSPSEFGR